MSKNLCILQYQQKLPLEKKMILMRENAIAGKKQHEEFCEKTRLNINEQLEEIESKAVYSIAENIAKQKNIPLIDALEEAKIIYNKTR